MEAGSHSGIPTFGTEISSGTSASFLTIVLSRDTQNWHDFDAFQLPTSTAPCELMDMSHYHEICISRFLLLLGLVGWAACAELSTGSVEASKAKHGRAWPPYGTQYIRKMMMMIIIIIVSIVIIISEVMGIQRKATSEQPVVSHQLAKHSCEFTALVFHELQSTTCFW
jgi:hypothetical protein